MSNKPISTSLPSSVLPNSQDLLEKAKAYLNERLQNLNAGGADSEELLKLKAQVNDLVAKSQKDEARLEAIEALLDKLKKELSELDAARLRRDLDKLHSLVH